MDDPGTLLKKLRDGFGESYAKNATFSIAPKPEEFDKLNIVKAVIHGVATGQRFLLIGDAGIGKTSFMRWVCRNLGVEMVYIPAANVSIENLMVPFPTKSQHSDSRVLEPIFYRQLVTPNPKVIVVDEIGRAERDMGNTVMELLQEGSLFGEPIPELLTVIAMDNHAGMEYGRLNSLDFAQADRLATVVMDHNGTPWARALAAKYSNVNLSQVFTTYARQPIEIRRTLSPRVLDHLIYALVNGFPGICALPIIMGERQKLKDKAGNDRTDEVLSAIASGLGVPNRDTVPDIMDRALDAVLRDEINVFFEGRPGLGKTSRIKAYLAAHKADLVYYSVPALSPEDLHVPFPSEDGSCLEVMPQSKLVSPPPPGGKKVIVWDEVCRGVRRTQNALMEIHQERTVGGQPIPGLAGNVGINNPKAVHGFKLDVGKSDMAQATRWTLSIQLRDNDTGWSAYLYGRYGEAITPFLEWWQDDIDDLGRALITPRTIERLYGLHAGGLPLEWGKAYVGGEYVAVALIDLERRLESQPLARLRQIAANIDDYERRLGADEHAEADHLTVFMALSKAELRQLEENFEVCVRLLGVLAPQHKINLIRPGGERQKFWHRVLMENKTRSEARSAQKKPA